MRFTVILALLMILFNVVWQLHQAAGADILQSSFGFSDFNADHKHELKLGGKAKIGNGTIRNNVLNLTPDADKYENAKQNPNAYVRGSAFYKNPVHLVNKYTTASFQSVFALSMKPVYQSNTGDGIVFVITSDPGSKGDSQGHFGFYPHAKQKRETLAIEFDSYKNPELYDIDNDHVGVDIQDPVSTKAVSARNVGILLNSGRPFTVWVEYSASFQKLEVRLQFGLSNQSRPLKPLISIPLALKQVAQRDMWVGFSAGTYYGQNQHHYVYSWSFSNDYIGSDQNSAHLVKAILAIVLCGFAIFTMIGFYIYRRNCRRDPADLDDWEPDSQGGNQPLQPSEASKCLPLPLLTGGDEQSDGQKSWSCLPRANEEQGAEVRPIDDDAIMYSNTTYTPNQENEETEEESAEEDADDIPVYPYELYPEEIDYRGEYSSSPRSFRPPNSRSSIF